MGEADIPGIAIDGVDQLDFFLGKRRPPTAKDFPRTWPIACPPSSGGTGRHLIWQETMYAPPVKLPLPKIINLPMTRRRSAMWPQSSWVADPVVKIVGEIEASFRKYPPIKVGTPDPYVPPK